MERPTSRQLAGVKHQIYHPQLPTLRRMDMDTNVHRLSTEHSRHTTVCSRDEFIKARTMLHARKPIVHCQTVTDNDTKTRVVQYHPLSKSCHIDEWNKIVNLLKQTNNQHTSSNRDDTREPTQFSGLFMRKKHPEITASWQHALTVKNPRQDRRENRPQTATKPIPATMYSRYRTTSRPYSAYPWY